MRFMLFCGINEPHWNALPATERDAIMDAYQQWVADTTASGHHVGGAKLDDSVTAHTLRQQGSRFNVVDGPFAETKEQIGGFHILECRDLEEALSIAKRIPPLAVGSFVEVRPLLFELK